MVKKRCIVCLISQQNVPNYLFIRQMFQPGDEILLIATHKVAKYAEYLSNTLQWPNAEIITCIFEKDGIENNWVETLSQIEKSLKEERHYVVNLTGGTKLLSIAVCQYLQKRSDCEFYYMSIDTDKIHRFDPNGNKTEDFTMSYNMGVEEYFSLCGRKLVNPGRCIRTKEENDKIFELFMNRGLMTYSDALSFLRKMRGKKSELGDDKNMRSIYNRLDKHDELKVESIPNGEVLLNDFGFNNTDALTKAEIEYLTGGWFEEWAYYMVKDELKLSKKDIVMGGHIDDTNGSELDVTFTWKNKLYIIECKSGIEKLTDLRGYLQKANSIRSNFRTLSAKSVLFGLADDAESWHEAANYLGLTYCSRDDLRDIHRRLSFIK